MVPGGCSSDARCNMAKRMNIWHWTLGIWRRIRRRNRVTGVVHVDAMSEVPDELGSKLYIVGRPNGRSFHAHVGVETALMSL